jgi:serine protease Do
VLVRIEGFGGLARDAAAGLTPGAGPTTGIIVSGDGYILTSTFNFLRKPPVITVLLPGGERKIARLLGRDETRRICLLKVDGVANLPVPAIAPRRELRVGQWAIALGVGFGDATPALSAGIISATSRISGKAVQTDANLSPANYGGPLIDLDGRLIGVCVPLSPHSREPAAGAEWYDSGIGFAIPLDGLDGVIGDLKAGKTLQWAFLGVAAKAAGATGEGVVVASIVAQSPAERAGLRVGDRIQAVAGTAIDGVPHLATVLGRYLAGDSVEIAVLRADARHTFQVELSARPPSPPEEAKIRDNEPAQQPN